MPTPAIGVIRTVGQRRLVVDVSDAARKFGIRSGMSAAEARALCGQLQCIDDDPITDRRALRALGRWCTRFTPVVAAHPKVMRLWESAFRPGAVSGSDRH